MGVTVEKEAVEKKWDTSLNYLEAKLQLWGMKYKKLTYDILLHSNIHQYKYNFLIYYLLKMKKDN